MSNLAWVTDMDSKVFSIIKAKTESTIKADYPDVFFTMENATNTTPQFPTIYIHSIGTLESETTLESDDIEMATYTFEVQIKAKGDVNGVNELFTPIIKAFKELKFVLVTKNDITITDSVYTGIARFRRSMANTDTF